MADIEHNALTGADLHECKGAATAALGSLLRAQGDGTALFEDVISELRTANKYPVYRTITDISTAGSFFVVAPVAGDIIAVHVVLDGALASADATVTLEIGGTLVTSSSVTVTQAGSAAGSTFSAAPSANNTVTAGQAIEIITDGGSTNAVAAHVTLLIDTE